METHSNLNKGVLRTPFFYAFCFSFFLYFYRIWIFYVYIVSTTGLMISSTTPYKLADIIRDTWPQLYRRSKETYNESSINIPQNIVTKMKFTVYSKDGCPYCTKVQQVLELANLQHVVYKLNTDFTREEFYSEFGNGSTFPQVIVNEKHIGGCNDTVRYLKEQNLV